MRVRGLTLPLIAVGWHIHGGKPLPSPLTTRAVGKGGPEVMKEGKLALPLMVAAPERVGHALCLSSTVELTLVEGAQVSQTHGA